MRLFSLCLDGGDMGITPTNDAEERACQLVVCYVPPMGTARGTRRSVENFTGQRRHAASKLKTCSTDSLRIGASTLNGSIDPASSNGAHNSSSAAPFMSIRTQAKLAAAASQNWVSRRRDFLTKLFGPGIGAGAGAANLAAAAASVRGRRGSIQERNSNTGGNQTPIDKRLLTEALSTAGARSRLANSDRGAINPALLSQNALSSASLANHGAGSAPAPPATSTTAPTTLVTYLSRGAAAARVMGTVQEATITV